MLHPPNLRAEFRFDFAPGNAEGPEPANHHRRRVKIAGGADERGNFARGEDGAARADIQMYADAKIGHGRDARNRVFGCGHVGHERCAGEEAVAVGENDRIRDTAAHSAIVGVDDEARVPHCRT